MSRNPFMGGGAPGVRPTLLTGLLLALYCAQPGVAQQRGGTVAGTVVNTAGAPVAEADVVASSGRGATTDALGRFVLADLRTATVTLRATRIGYLPAELVVRVPENGTTTARLVLREQPVEVAGVVVSATRETRLKAETPVSVGTVGAEEIRAVRPKHPSEILGQVAGVWVAQTSGEGHTTAIRQPKSTKPMYLFLEDGVPTRSTGFFNHNALYEINVPQAERIEVLKGPGTALYGSDAIGGVINVETRRASLAPQVEGSYEGGSNGWSRLLVGGGATLGQHGLRADLNYTHSDGFQAATGYDRVSATARWDAYLAGNAKLRTVASFSTIDQNEGSALTRADYEGGSTANYNPIAFRQIQAFRLSAAYERPLSRGLLSVTPYVRSNRMEILPFWMLAFDPVVYETGNHSAGALGRLRWDLPVWETQLVGGLDVEYSPGYRREDVVTASREGRSFVGYTRGPRVYDYDVAFRGVSPYLQADLSPTDRLRLSLGVRYDRVGYAYDTHLDPVSTGRWRRPADTTLWYGHLSPKAGLTYNLSPALGLFGAYRHGFRAPSEGQLFRQGSSANGPDLQPVKVDSYEAGVRGALAGRLSYELSAYRMDIRDDILTYVEQTGSTFNRVNVNAGRTRHDGVEVGLGAELAAGVRLDASWSSALHTYREWAPSATQSFSGKRIETAPRTLASVRLGYAPGFAPGARLAAEWSRVGSYYMDPANEHRYGGHSLLNLRASVPVTRSLEINGSVTNLLDERYAENAAYNAAEGETFNPGAPRLLNLAVQYRWER